MTLMMVKDVAVRNNVGTTTTFPSANMQLILITSIMTPLKTVFLALKIDHEENQHF